jgi:nicotinate-nucleotide adenylyltransferase
MRAGVLGGTFDPIHIGHLILAENAREQLQLDKVIFIPAGEPWRKAHRDVTSARNRLAMTRLAVQDNPHFEVDDCEVTRPGATYTVDTLRELNSRSGAADELYLILGEDALVDLPQWRDPEGISREAMLVVAPREGSREPEDLPFDPARVVRVEMPYIAVSSTDLRQRARDGRSLRYMLPQPVEDYIRRNKLYLA